MRFPRLLFAQAFINVPFALTYALTSYFAINSLHLSSVSGMRHDFPDLFLIVFIAALAIAPAIWLFASFILIRMSGLSYCALIMSFLAAFTPAGIVLAADGYAVLTHLNELGDPTVTMFSTDILMFLGISLIAPAWFLLMLLRPYHIRWARSRGPFYQTIINPVLLVPAILILLSPFAACLTVNAAGILVPVDRFTFTSSSGSGSFTQQPEEIFCFWTPTYGRGIGEWIRLSDIGAEGREKESLTLVLSSADGNFSRMKTVLIETSRGERFTRHFDNSGEDQAVAIAPGCTWINLTFQESYPGQKKDILRISKVELLAKRKNFIPLEPQYSDFQ